MNAQHLQAPAIAAGAERAPELTPEDLPSVELISAPLTASSRLHTLSLHFLQARPWQQAQRERRH